QPGDVSPRAVAPCSLGAGEVHLCAVKGRHDLGRLLLEGVLVQRLVDRGYLGVGAEDLAGSLKPLVVHVDGDARHAAKSTSRSTSTWCIRSVDGRTKIISRPRQEGLVGRVVRVLA